MDSEDVETPRLEDATLIEKINKDDLVPLFTHDHVHTYVKGEEETVDYYDEVCTIKGCGMGRLVAKR